LGLGWAFEKLIHGGEFLEEVTHLVLDEGLLFLGGKCFQISF
jgi:hypothetical protein